MEPPVPRLGHWPAAGRRRPWIPIAAVAYRVGGNRLDHMSKVVTVVEHLSAARSGDPRSLDPHRANDEFGLVCPPARIRVEQLQDHWVGDESALDDLGQTRALFRRRQAVL